MRQRCEISSRTLSGRFSINACLWICFQKHTHTNSSLVSFQSDYQNTIEGKPLPPPIFFLPRLYHDRLSQIILWDEWIDVFIAFHIRQSCFLKSRFRVLDIHIVLNIIMADLRRSHNKIHFRVRGQSSRQSSRSTIVPKCESSCGAHIHFLELWNN